MVGFVLSENYHFSIFIEKTYPQKSFFIFYGMEWALFLWITTVKIFLNFSLLPKGMLNCYKISNSGGRFVDIKRKFIV